MNAFAKHIPIAVGIFLSSVFAYAQEDLVSQQEILTEQQNINFQTFFFESLQQKGIENYDKAIFALDACFAIDKESIPVLFELSKNYAFLTKYSEAEFYILKGLELEPANIYMLRHLEDVKSKQNDFKGAILIRQKILEQKPSEVGELVLLYIKAGEIENAIILMQKLDAEEKLPSSLLPLKESLTQIKRGEDYQPKIIAEELPKSKVDLLKEEYSLKKDFNSLKLLVETELQTKEYLDLLKDSEEGMNLYPMQPYFYLMHSMALNNTGKYKDAITILELGLEFIIDDNDMESQFMEQLSLSYKALGENKIASSYYKKALDLRNK